jgi:hypothetical protein
MVLFAGLVTYLQMENVIPAEAGIQPWVGDLRAHEGCKRFARYGDNERFDNQAGVRSAMSAVRDIIISRAR